MEKTDQTEEGTKSESTDKTVDNQEEVSTKESSDSEGKETEELFELPDGRKVDAKELSKAWKENFYPEFTRRSQKLKAFEKAEAKKADVGKEALKRVGEDDKLKNIPPDVREAVWKIVEGKIKKLNDERFQKEQQEKDDREYAARLEKLEKEFSGKDGKPKFDRREVLEAMRDPNNKNFDPLSKFRELHHSELLDYEVKQALKKQKGAPSSETTGHQDPLENKSEKGRARTFAEASKRAFARMNS